MFHINAGIFTPNVVATLILEKYKMDRTPNSKKRKKSSTFDVSNTCKVIQKMIKFKTS